MSASLAGIYIGYLPVLHCSVYLMSSSGPHWLKPNDLFLLVFINALWGLNLITAKFGLAELPPVLFAALRITVMLVICVPWLRWLPGQMGVMLGVALCTGVGGFGLLTIGLSLSKDVSTVAIFTQLCIPFSALLSVFVLKEMIHWRRKLGISLAFIGALVIGFDPRALSYLPGLLFIVAQSVCVALGMMYVKRLQGAAPLQVQAWIAALAAPPLLLLSLLMETHQWQAIESATWVAWAAVLFAAIFSSLVGHSLLFHLLKRYPVSLISPMLVLSTIFGVLFGVVFNHDAMTGRIWLGGALTLIGVVIVSVRDPRWVETGT